MTEFTHNCLSCNTQYKDTDPDPYYCSPCKEKKQALAKKLDAQPRTTPQVKSDYQRYEELAKTQGVKGRGGITSVPAKFFF